MQPNNLIHSQDRATCPMCRREMVYTALITNGEAVWVWLCNCRIQPTHIHADVEDARKTPGMNLTYTLEIFNA